MPSYSDMLRQDRSYGALGMLSGDKVLAPMGEQLTKQSVITPDQAFSLLSAIQARATAAQQGAQRLAETARRTGVYERDVTERRNQRAFEQDRMRTFKAAEVVRDQRNTDTLNEMKASQQRLEEEKLSALNNREAEKLAQRKVENEAKVAERKAVRRQRAGEAVNNYTLKYARLLDQNTRTKYRGQEVSQRFANEGKELAQNQQKIDIMRSKVAADAKYRAATLAQGADEFEKTFGLKRDNFDRFVVNDKIANDQWLAEFGAEEAKRLAGQGIAGDRLEAYRETEKGRNQHFKLQLDQDDQQFADGIGLDKEEFSQAATMDGARIAEVRKKNRNDLMVDAANLGAKYVAMVQKDDNLSDKTDAELAAYASKHSLDVEKLQTLRDRHAALRAQEDQKIAAGRQNDADQLGLDTMKWTATVMDRTNRHKEAQQRRLAAAKQNAARNELDFNKVQNHEKWRDAQKQEWASKRQDSFSEFSLGETGKDIRLGETLNFRREQEQRRKAAEDMRSKQFYDKMEFTAEQRQIDRDLRLQMAREKRDADAEQYRPVKSTDSKAILQMTSAIENVQELYDDLVAPDSLVKPVSALGWTLPEGVQNFAQNLAKSETNPGEMLPESAAEAMWFSKYKRAYEAVERHKLFGAALTKTELPEWKAMSIVKSMSPKMRQQWLEEWLMNAKREALRLKNSMASEHYNPATLDVMMPFTSKAK